MEQRDPELKVAWVERGNPVTQNPETSKVIEAFRALDFRVVVDQFLQTRPARPTLSCPAKTMFEQTDVMNAYWHPYIQIKANLIDSPGEVQARDRVLWDLAQRYGGSEGDRT